MENELIDDALQKLREQRYSVTLSQEAMVGPIRTQ